MEIVEGGKAEDLEIFFVKVDRNCWMRICFRGGGIRGERTRGIETVEIRFGRRKYPCSMK